VFYEVGMLDQFVVANKCVEVGYRQGAFSGEDPRGWFLIAHRLA